MKPELRKKLLEDMGKNSYGMAMSDYIEEQITKMSDITRLTPENVDANRMAVIELKKMFAFLNRLKTDKPEKSNNIYK